MSIYKKKYLECYNKSVTLKYFGGICSLKVRKYQIQHFPKILKFSLKNSLMNKAVLCAVSK